VPYSGPNDRDLPEAVKKLPKRLRAIWVAAFNATHEKKPDDESYAFRVAWAAVRRAREGKKMAEEEKAKKKTEGGMQFGPRAYLYVPDPDKPITWKIRIEEEPGKVTVAQLGRAAAAIGPKGFRGRKADIPNDDRRRIARKLISLYRKHDVPDEDIPEYLWGIAGMSKPKKKSVNLRTTLTDIEAALPRAFPGLDVWAVEVFDDHVIVSVHEPGGGPAGRRYYKVPYEVTYKQVEGDPNETEVIDGITFAPREEWVQVIPTFTALKVMTTPDGRARWFAISSGGFEDRDREVVSTAFLESAVKAADESGDRGPLLVYHVPGARIGGCDFQAVVGGFLLESGLFDDSEAGRRAAEHLREHAKEYGVSIKFLYRNRTEDGVYEPPGLILERSVLPRDAAAFPWSAFDLKETEASKMIDERKKEELVKLVGEDEAERILGELEENTEILKQVGVRFKEVQDVGPEESGADGQEEEEPEGGAAEVKESGATGDVDGYEIVLSPESLQAIAKELACDISAAVEEKTAATMKAVEALQAAVESLAETVDRLARAEDERIEEKVRDLPRATLRRIRRPTRDNPPLSEKEAGGEEEVSLAEIAERSLGLKG